MPAKNVCMPTIMTPTEQWKKRIWFGIAVIYFVLGYMGCNHWLEYNAIHYHTLDLPLERSIPMMPIFIFGYLLIYVCLVLIYFIFDDYKQFKFTVGAFLWITTIHYAIFFLYPVRMVYRPDLDGHPSWISALTAWYFTLDYPNNCFPSLHVAYPFLGTLALWNYKRGWAWIFAAFTVIIAVSVIMVKQHYILDAVGAIIVTSIGYWMYVMFRKPLIPLE